MWQRVQTLYIFLATALVGALFFVAKAVRVDNGETVAYTAYIPYLVLIALISFLNVLALTTYTRRVFQMRTVGLSAILTLALQAWLAVDYFTTSVAAVFNITIVFPLVAVIFDLLAIRGIWGDELLVRSSSRLRAAKRNR